VDLYLPQELAEKVESARGGLSLSEWIREAVARALA
jgi:hypothetical protein